MRYATALILLAAAAFVARIEPGDPALYPVADGTGARVYVVDHGFHAGIVIPAADLRAAAMRLARDRPDLAHVLRSVTQDYPFAEWLEIGWGDAGFYREAPRLDDVTAGLAWRALFEPSPSVLHVVPGWGDPGDAFLRADVVALALSQDGVVRLARALAETFAPDAIGSPQPDGPSLYGQGAFYPAAPSYHLFNTCNHWLSGLLATAGVPSSWSFSMTSAGLMAELDWRAR